MMESKKIKKLEKINRNSAARFKKNGLKPPRVQTGLIDRPPRLFDQSQVHLLESVRNFSFQPFTSLPSIPFISSPRLTLIGYVLRNQQ